MQYGRNNNIMEKGDYKMRSTKVIAITLCALLLFEALAFASVSLGQQKVLADEATFYSTASDGFLEYGNSSYTVAHNAAYADWVRSSFNVLAIGQVSSGGYYIQRGALFFNTSSLPDNADITSATLSLYGYFDESTIDFDVTVVDGSLLDEPLVASDYGDLRTQTTNGGGFNTVGFSTSGYNDIYLNAVGMGWISKTGITKFGLRSSRDITATAPSGLEHVGVHPSESVGGDGYRPKLVVSYRSAMVAAGGYHTVGMRSNGTVLATGNNGSGQCNVSEWTDIQQVAAGFGHTVALKSNSTVVATGNNFHGQCNVSDWTGIKQVAAGHGQHTVGLLSNGSVVATGENDDGQCDIDGWTDIQQLTTGTSHTVGLRLNSTVVAIGDNGYLQCDVGSWTDIQQVEAGAFHTVGLKSDDTVVATGSNSYGQCDVGGWSDIHQVAAGRYHTVALLLNGTVLATGRNDDGQCNVSEWTDILQLAAGDHHTVGLRSDGTVVATGYNNHGQCNVSGWRLFESPDLVVIGLTRQVNCDILPGVEIALDGIGPVLSDIDGNYTIMAPGPGDYTINASKEGFRSRAQYVLVEGPDPVTFNFQGEYGLIPCSPDMWYALDCVNLWLYPPAPPPECGLDMWTALDVVNAWLYPGCT